MRHPATLITMPIPANYYYIIITISEKGKTVLEISSAFIKYIKHEVVVPLTIRFSKSLVSGIVPDLMKLAKLIPIYIAKRQIPT